jgi:hypothetical protein
MRFTVVFLMLGACFGQGKQNVVQTGVVDAGTLAWIAPHATFASPPSPLVAGAVYVFTDASTTGTCTGGGSALATCRYSGSAWVAVAGGGTPDASIFSGGVQVLRSVQCAHGTISYTALTAAAASQEITIQTGISGNVRWDGAVISETTQFVSTTGLTVSMGRPGSSTHAELTNGILFPLQVSASDANYVSTRPIPPQITDTYNIVLNFAVTSGNVNAATAGSVTGAGCGYAAR